MRPLDLDIIIQHYNGQGSYHNWDHIMACLNLLDKAREFGLLTNDKDYKIARRALILHDLPRDMALELAESAEVCTAIKQTFYFDKDWPYANQGVPAIVSDIDLSILGHLWGTYCAYRDSIYEEYAHVTPSVFKATRIAMLKHLALNYPPSNLSFYKYMYFQKRFPHALENIWREIAELECLT